MDEGAARVKLGILLAIVALFLRAAKTVVVDRAMNRMGNDGHDYPTLEPMQVLVYQTPCIMLCTLILAVFDDFIAPLQRLPSIPSSEPLLLFALLCNIASAN